MTARPRSLARPPALRPGDRVAVLSASGPAPPADLRLGLAALRFAGLEPVVYPSAEDGGSLRRYLAGDDQLRAGDLRSALTDASIAGILFACGGYGAQRTLAALDWDGLAGLPPKVLAGYSDVTAILEAAAARLGWAGREPDAAVLVAGYQHEPSRRGRDLAHRGVSRGGLPDRPHAHPAPPLRLPGRGGRDHRRHVHRLR